MEHRVKCRFRIVGRVWMLMAAAAVLIPSNWDLCGSDVQPQHSLSSIPGISVSLEHKEVNYRVAWLNTRVAAQSSAFSREPTPGERGVRRGRLGFGAPGEKPMPFIWDPSQGRLHLDLNRNEDLTDDPDGVFTADGHGDSLWGDSSYQTFADVRLAIPTEAGSYPVLMDLTFSAFGAVRVRGYLRSYYSGQITLDDREWEIGLVAHPGGQPALLAGWSLLLRPWVERDQSFEVGRGATDAFPFSSDLFLYGRAYDVSGAFDFTVSPPVYRLEFQGQPFVPGELVIRGEHIRRLLLRDGPWTAILDEPTGTIPVPAGSYAAHMVELRHGDARAYPLVWPADRGIQRQTVIEPGQPTELVVGGPLTNMVQVNRRTHHVNFDHQLVGAGGQPYRIEHQGLREAPQFTVFRGDKVVATGNFEFG